MIAHMQMQKSGLGNGRGWIRQVSSLGFRADTTRDRVVVVSAKSTGLFVVY